MTDLKPCPFCGGKAIERYGPESWIECTECHACSAMHTNIEISIIEWNRRVSNEIQNAMG